MNKVRVGTLYLLILLTLLSYSIADSQTPTSVPADANAAVWHDLLTPTEACPLPCWWGIIPGETTSEEAQAILVTKFDDLRFYAGHGQDEHGDYWRLGAALNLADSEANMEATPAFDPDEEDWWLEVVTLAVSSYQEQGYIDFIEIDSAPFSHIEKVTYIWEYFDIINILNLYGIPEQAYVRTIDTSEGRKITTILFVWEQLNTAIAYDFPSSVWYKEERKHISPLTTPCFTVSALKDVYLYDLIEIKIKNPNNPVTFLELFNWIPSERIMLTNVTGLTTAEFVDILLENDGCIPDNIVIEEVENN